MAINEELYGFLKDGLDRGLARDELERVLLESGWPREQVRGALDGFADVAFPIPVPRPKPYLSAREAFIYLVLFSTMYASAISLGTLVFQLIDRAFPDPAADPAVTLAMTREAIRWSIAWLVVAFPTFVAVARWNGRAIERDPLRRLSQVRRWLTYLTLFVGAGILIGVLTTIVYNLLSGELTARFVSQVATIAVITGSVFGYFLSDIRKDEMG
jgi:hypothetical protein